VEVGVVKHWFLPENLQEQMAVTIGGIEAFARWSGGDAESEAALRAAEHAADDVRRRLQVALRAAFSTPLDAEDLYELSERIDVVLNEAKNAAREAEVMALTPDAHLAEMATALLDGMRHLQTAFGALVKAPDEATAAADAAVKSEREIERAYRRAMKDLLDVAELRQVMAWREMYRRYARIGEALEHAAHRVWYAVVKES
jgi:uncharacterized protein Yka (UPF0111/DUF47 family)